jgi:citrate lyase subunit beta/citryl-CoA lyase
MLAALSFRHLQAIVLPKINDRFSLDTILLRSPSMTSASVWAMIETAKGVIKVEEIASHPSVTALVFGSNDLTQDIRAYHTNSREPLLYSMSRTILAARAHHKRVFDGVHLDVNDNDGLAVACMQARSLGFDGKTLIHPNQVAVANKCFLPTNEEVAYSRRVVSAFEDARAQGKSVCAVDGRLVEGMHVERALEVIETDDYVKSTFV